MAVVIGFRTDKQGTEGGHAIAMHRSNAGEYRFFDPNFGSVAYRGFTHAATASSS